MQPSVPKIASTLLITTGLEHIISNKRPGVVHDIYFENSCTSNEAGGINVTISAQNTIANTTELLFSVFSNKTYFLVQWIESDNVKAYKQLSLPATVPTYLHSSSSSKSSPTLDKESSSGSSLRMWRAAYDIK